MNAAKLLAFALAALVGAGCVGGSSSSSTVDAPTMAPTVEAEPVAAAPPLPPPAPAPPPVLRETPIAYSGKTGTGACARADAVGHCAWADEGSERNHAIPLDAKPISLKGTVEHTTSAPGTFGVSVCVEHAEGLFECPRGFEGASPLAFEWDFSAFVSAKSLKLSVHQRADPAGSLPAQAWALTPAEFKVDATLATLSG